jgi:hypothetical protein
MAHLNSTATPFACAPELPEKVEPSISNTAIAPPRYATFSKTKTTHESASAAVPSPEAAQEQKRARARERERSAWRVVGSGHHVPYRATSPSTFPLEDRRFVERDYPGF